MAREYTDRIVRIALLHGFPGFARIGPLEYFRDVPAHLRRKFPDVEVLTPTVEAAGDVKTRASQLAGQVAGQERAHLICHSGGGKDARYLVSPQGLGRSDLAASITTISTPHHGSLIADCVAGVLEVPSSALEKLRSAAEGVRGFTTAEMQKFNEEIRPSPDVRYRSYAGLTQPGDRGVRFGIFAIALPLIQARDGDNDGWVSVRSSTYPGPLTGTLRADHAGEIGWNVSLVGATLDKVLGRKFDHLAFYEGLVRELRQQPAVSGAHG